MGFPGVLSCLLHWLLLLPALSHSGSVRKRSSSWAYEGSTGPKHWAGLRPGWSLCGSGKFQSPIDIQTDSLLFDPTLRRMNLDFPKSVSGTLRNTGRGVELSLDSTPNNAVNLTDGPMTYRYRVASLAIRFGPRDQQGSEHTVQGLPFAAEIQLLAYNADLHGSLEDAIQAPHGLASIAVLAEVGEPPNTVLKSIAGFAQHIQWKGEETQVKELSAHALIPDTNYYLTYEGSLTQPGCQETVTWIIFNKPILVDKDTLTSLRRLQQVSRSDPPLPLISNRRPTMPVNNRVIRTNINYPTSGGICSMARQTYYELNPTLRLH